MTDPAPGIVAHRLDPWLARHVPGAEAPFGYERIAGGGSNLTYRVTDAAGVIRVLRRPPEGRALQSAHDMAREVTIIRALDAHGAIPVPRWLAGTDDPDITGAGFYVMEFVDGAVLRTIHDAAHLSPADAEQATDSLVATQVAMHTIDLEAAGLADLGRHDGYVARQLKRWRRQVDTAAVRDLPQLGRLHDRLAATVPPERAAPALAHGDYRFDNAVLGADHRIAAVLDWELCTTGDPIADFAWSIQYWADPDDAFTWLPDAPTLHPAFARRAEVIRRYEQASGFDLSDLAWYHAFSWWKQACIVEGVYARRLAAGAGGADASGIEAIADRVVTMLDHATHLADVAGI